MNRFIQRSSKVAWLLAFVWFVLASFHLADAQSLINQTFQQPKTTLSIPAAANGQTGNQKLAQTINLQDYELPDSSQSCNASTWRPSTGVHTVTIPGRILMVVDPAGHAQKATTAGTTGTTQPTWNDSGGTTTDGTVTWTDQGLAHDDGPALNRATQYAVSNGGGTVNFTPGSTCYFKSFNSQVVAVLIPHMTTGITYELNGAHLILDPSVANGVIFGSTPYFTGDSFYDKPLYAFPGANLPQYSNAITLPSGATCSNFPLNNWIWLNGGYGSGNERLGEINRVANCDSSAGIITPFWPTSKQYLGAAGAITWAATSSYSLGTTLIDSGTNDQAGNPHIQQVTTAGTSGSTIPVFNDSPGTGVPVQTTNDGSVVWTDRGPWGVSNVNDIITTNIEIRDGTLTVSGEGPVAVYQTYGLKLTNLKMENTVGNEEIISGRLRHVVLDNVSWDSVYNTSPTGGAGPYQIGDNTVDVEVMHSHLNSQDVQEPPIQCTEFGANINIHDNPEINSAAGITNGNCVDMTWHHNRSVVSVSNLTGFQAGFVMGGCCGSTDVSNSEVSDSDFEINVPPPGSGSPLGMILGGSHMRFHHNHVKLTSGGTGTLMDWAGSGIGGLIDDNDFETDGNAISVNSAAVDLKFRGNTFRGTASATALGTFSAASGTITLSSIAGTPIVGNGISCPGVPDGSVIQAYSSGTVTLNMGQFTSSSQSNVPCSITDFTTGILLNGSTQQYGVGPGISGNSFSDFYWGVRSNAASLMPNRDIGINSFSGVALRYSPVNLAPIQLSNTVTETQFSGTNGAGCPYNVFYDPGSIVCGKGYFGYPGFPTGISRVTPTNDMVLVLEGNGNISQAILSTDGAQMFLKMYTPSHPGYIAMNTAVSPVAYVVAPDGVVQEVVTSAAATFTPHVVTPSVTATGAPSAFAAGTTVGGNPIVGGATAGTGISISGTTNVTITNTSPLSGLTISNGAACSGGTPRASTVVGSLSGTVLTLTPTCVP